MSLGAFNPDAYLKQETPDGFNPDAYLGEADAIDTPEIKTPKVDAVETIKGRPVVKKEAFDPSQFTEKPAEVNSDLDLQYKKKKPVIDPYDAVAEEKYKTEGAAYYDRLKGEVVALEGKVNQVADDYSNIDWEKYSSQMEVDKEVGARREQDEFALEAKKKEFAKAKRLHDGVLSKESIVEAENKAIGENDALDARTGQLAVKQRVDPQEVELNFMSKTNPTEALVLRDKIAQGKATELDLSKLEAQGLSRMINVNANELQIEAEQKKPLIEEAELIDANLKKYQELIHPLDEQQKADYDANLAIYKKGLADTEPLRKEIGAFEQIAKANDGLTEQQLADYQELFGKYEEATASLKPAIEKLQFYDKAQGGLTPEQQADFDAQRARLEEIAPQLSPLSDKYKKIEDLRNELATGSMSKKAFAIADAQTKRAQAVDDWYKEQNWFDQARYNSGNVIEGTLARFASSIISLPRTIAAHANNIPLMGGIGYKYDATDALADFATSMTEYMDGFTPSNLGQELAQDYAVINGLKVVVKNGEVESVRDADGFLIRDPFAIAKATQDYEENKPPLKTEYNEGAGAYHAANAIMDMGVTLLPIGGLVGKWAKGLGAADKVADAVGIYAGSFLLIHKTAYEDGLAAGLSPELAGFYAHGMAAIETATETLNPLEMKLIRKLRGGSSASRLGAEEFARRYVAGASKTSALTYGLGQVVKNMGMEGFEEMGARYFGDKLDESLNVLAASDFDVKSTTNEYFGDFVVGAATGLAFSPIVIAGSRSDLERQTLSMLVESPDDAIKYIDALVGKTVLDNKGEKLVFTQEQADAVKLDMKNLTERVNSIKDISNLDDEKKVTVTALVQHKMALERELAKPNLDDIAKKKYKALIEGANKQLELLAAWKAGDSYITINNEVISEADFKTKMTPEFVKQAAFGSVSVIIGDNPVLQEEFRKQFDEARKGFAYVAGENDSVDKLHSYYTEQLKAEKDPYIRKHLQRQLKQIGDSPIAFYENRLATLEPNKVVLSNLYKDIIADLRAKKGIPLTAAQAAAQATTKAEADKRAAELETYAKERQVITDIYEEDWEGYTDEQQDKFRAERERIFKEDKKLFDTHASSEQKAELKKLTKKGFLELFYTKDNKRRADWDRYANETAYISDVVDEILGVSKAETTIATAITATTTAATNSNAPITPNDVKVSITGSNQGFGLKAGDQIDEKDIRHVFDDSAIRESIASGTPLQVTESKAGGKRVIRVIHGTVDHVGRTGVSIINVELPENSSLTKEQVAEIASEKIKEKTDNNKQHEFYGSAAEVRNVYDQIIAEIKQKGTETTKTENNVSQQSTKGVGTDPAGNKTVGKKDGSEVVEGDGEKETAEKSEEALKDVESTAKALSDISWDEKEKYKKFYYETVEGKYRSFEEMSEAYHKAKADGSNPEWVNAVETLLSKSKTNESKGSKLEEQEDFKKRRTDLFPEESVFGASDDVGKLKQKAKITAFRQVGDIGVAEYTNPTTGVVDVYIAGRNDNSFVAYIRIYDKNGKPTNRFTSKFENTKGTKADFKTMITEVQKALPQGHEWTEDTSISTDGLNALIQNIERGSYEILLDENGKPVTETVFINGDSKTNVLGVPVNKGNFDNVQIKNKEDFEKAKKALLPIAEKLGLTESDINWINGGIEINLPVLKSKTNENKTDETASKTDTTNQTGSTTQTGEPSQTQARAVNDASETKDADTRKAKEEEIADDVNALFGVDVKFNPDGTYEITGEGDIEGARTFVDEATKEVKKVEPKGTLEEQHEAIVKRQGEIFEKAKTDAEARAEYNSLNKKKQAIERQLFQEKKKNRFKEGSAKYFEFERVMEEFHNNSKPLLRKVIEFIDEFGTLTFEGNRWLDLINTAFGNVEALKPILNVVRQLAAQLTYTNEGSSAMVDRMVQSEYWKKALKGVYRSKDINAAKMKKRLGSAVLNGIKGYAGYTEALHEDYKKYKEYEKKGYLKGIPKSDEAPVKEQPKEPLSEARQFGVDFANAGLVETREIGGRGNEHQRLDLRMSNDEKIRAIKDIKEGNYETTAAKMMLDRIEQMYNEGALGYVMGSGGSTQQAGAVPIEDAKKHIEDIKQGKPTEEAPKPTEDEPFHNATAESIPEEIHTAIVDRIKNALSQAFGTAVHIVKDAKELMKAATRREPFAEVINGFYSPIENAINSFKPNEATAEKWLSIVGKGDEAVWTGVKAWLENKDPKGVVSKGEILKWMKDNRIKIKVVKKSDNRVVEGNRLSYPEIDSGGLPKFSTHQTAGDKSDYQEVLITMPNNKKRIPAKEFRAEIERLEGLREGAMIVGDTERVQMYDERLKKANTIAFQSSHYDEPNILAHLRMNTRTDANGKKVLFLEEVQSDWGQKGRKKGFVDGDVDRKKKRFGELEKMVLQNGKRNLTKADFAEWEKLKIDPEVINRGYAPIPQAPFVTQTGNWVKLALKVALQEAVKQGADKIAWTTGEQQNDRYDLSKSVGGIRVIENSKGGYEVYTIQIGQEWKTANRIAQNVDAKKLEDIVGKEIAQKTIGGQETFEGDDLKVGGKGMLGFYGSPTDGKLGVVGEIAKSLFKQEPKTVKINIGDSARVEIEKLGAEWAADGTVRTGVDGWGVFWQDGGLTKTESFKDKNKALDFLKKKKEEIEQQKRDSINQSIDITPEMVASAKEGQPLFHTKDGNPIGFNYDTDQVARERFDLSKLKQIGKGSDRTVFDLGNGKVLKIAHTARGLAQNIYEGDGYLAGDVIPEVHERGLNYVVTDNAPRLKAADIVPVYDWNSGEEIGTERAGDMMKELAKFSQTDFDEHNADLEAVLAKYGFTDIFSYDVLFGDFSAMRNWGYKDGKPLHIDGGTFGGIERIIKAYRGKTSMQDADFRDIYFKSRAVKKGNKETDKFTKFQDQKGEPLGFADRNGDIWLNGEKINGNTPVHEAGHLWQRWAAEHAPHLLKAGLDKISRSPYLAQVRNNKFYIDQADKKGLKGKEREDFFRNEALAMAIGDKGEQFVTEAKKADFQAWLSELWKAVAEFAGLSEKTAAQIENMTMDEFAKAVAADLLSGKTLKGKVEGKGNSEFQIIGERAVSKVENHEKPHLRQIADNLGAAKEMEKSGMSPKEIWLATGWERSKDKGKWKYDLPDVEFNKNVGKIPTKTIDVSGRGYTFKEVKLSEIIADDKGLFELYPQAKDINVVLYDFNHPDHVRGTYREGSTMFPEDTITLWGVDYSGNLTEEQQSTLLHEMQHFVQAKEGFASGGNENTVSEKDIPVNPKWAEYNTPENKKRAAEYIALRDSEEYARELAESNALFKDYGDRIDELHKQITRENHKEITDKVDAIFEEFNEVAKEKFPVMTKADAIAKETVVREPSKTISKFEAYRRLAGEVESRNVQGRADLTLDERKEKLISETEDVAEGSKIYLYAADSVGGVGSYASAAASPMSLAIDAAIEAVALTTELTGALAELLDMALIELRNSDAYKSRKSQLARDTAEAQLKAKLKERISSAKATAREEEPKDKKHKLAVKAINSPTLAPEIKQGVLDKGITYLERPVKLRREEAEAIINGAANLDAVFDYLMGSNKLRGDVKVALQKALADRYSKLGGETTGEEQESHRQRVADILYEAFKLGEEAGQVVNMQKEWSSFLQNDPEGFVSLVSKFQKKKNKAKLDKHEGEIADTIDTLNELLESEEGKNLIDDTADEDVTTEQNKPVSKGYIDRAMDALEKAHIAFKSKTYSDVTGVTAGIIDGAFSTAKVTLRATKNIADAIDAAVDYIKAELAKSGISTWAKEAEFRKDLEASLTADGIRVPKKRAPKQKKAQQVKDVAEALKEKLAKLEDFVKNPDKAIKELEEKKRKAEERLAKNEAKSEEIKALEKQIAETKAAVRRGEQTTMLDALIKDPIRALEALEAKKKRAEERAANNEGKSEAVKAIENEIKIKKSLVKLIQGMDTLTANQKRQILSDALDSIIKNGYLSEPAFRDIFAKALGLETLTAKDEQVLRKAALVIGQVAVAQQAFLANPTKANKAAYHRAMRQGRLANAQVSKYFKDRATTGDILSSIMRGGLLSTTTVVLSAKSNLLTLPVWLSIDAGASALDYLLYQSGIIGALSKTFPDRFEDRRYNDFLANKIGAWNAIPQGLREGLGQFITGQLPDSVYEKEMRSALHPIEAWTRIIKGMKGEEQQALIHYLNDGIEGTAGVPAEVIFRLLGLTDTPVRYAAEQGALMDLLKTKLSGERKALEKKPQLSAGEAQLLDDIKSGIELKRRMVDPDVDSLEASVDEGARAVFQNKNYITLGLEKFANALSKETAKKFGDGSNNPLLLKNVLSLVKLIKVTQFPFVNMPLNWAQAAIMLSNPVIPLGLGIFSAIKGDVRNANKMFSMAFVGFMLGTAIEYIVKSGVLQGSAGDDDEDERNKAMLAKGGYKRMNWSLFKRNIYNWGKEDTQWKEGDTTFEFYQQGVTGAMLLNYADLYKNYGTELDAQHNIFLHYLTYMGYKGAASVNTSLDMPTLIGTSQIINALATGDALTMDKLIVQSLTATRAIAAPATYVKWQKASDADALLKNTADEGWYKKFKNTYKDQIGDRDKLPNRHTMWGEPILRTPSGANAWVYNLFDISKSKKIPSTFGMELYNMHDRLSKENSELAKDVLPPHLGKSITIDKTTHKLDTEQYELYLQIVGLNRKKLVSGYISGSLTNNEMAFTTDSDEQRVHNLQSLYEFATKLGKKEFIEIQGWDAEDEEKGSLLNLHLHEEDYGQPLRTRDDFKRIDDEAAKNFK